MDTEQREMLEILNRVYKGTNWSEPIRAALADIDDAQRHVADLKSELDAVYASRAALTQRLDEYKRAVREWAKWHRYAPDNEQRRPECAALFALASLDKEARP